MAKTTIAKLIATLSMSAMLQPAFAGVCDLAEDDSVQAAAAVAGTGATAGAGLTAAGIGAVAHSSGALIVTTAGGGYVAGTLGALGTVTAVLTAPATIVVGGVIAVGLGSAAIYCALSD